MEGPPLLEPVYSKHSIINIFPYTNSEIVLHQHILLLVYYKIFDAEGPLKIRNAIYSNNPYIGRVDANDVPPLHNVSSLTRHICAKLRKGFGVDWKYGDDYSTELFKTISSPKASDLQELLSLLGTDRPGSRPQDPLVLKIAKNIKYIEAC
jgi:hypothetical protein